MVCFTHGWVDDDMKMVTWYSWLEKHEPCKLAWLRPSVLVEISFPMRTLSGPDGIPNFARLQAASNAGRPGNREE